MNGFLTVVDCFIAQLLVDPHRWILRHHVKTLLLYLDVFLGHVRLVLWLGDLRQHSVELAFMEHR